MSYPRFGFVRSTALLVTVLALAACGSSATSSDATDPVTPVAADSSPAAEPADSTTSSSPSEETTTPVGDPTIERAAFCDDVDLDSVSDAFGAHATVVDQLKPGEKYEGIPGQPKPTSEWWTCSIKIDNGPLFYVYLWEKDKSRADLQAEASRWLRARSAPSGGCEKGAAPEFGETALFVSCSIKPDGQQVVNGSSTFEYFGLFDAALVRCTITLGGPDDIDAITTTARTVCPDLLRLMAA